MTAKLTPHAIRRALIHAYGPRHYRITREGEIHVYGQMPNTSAIGWYLYGYIDDPDTLARIANLVES